jgi:hypothetical protein
MAENPCFLGQATKRDIEKLPQEHVTAFWQYAKDNGLFKGLNPDETRQMIADNFKIPERVVAWIMDRNKTARVISEEARARQKITANFLANNRRYLADMDKSGLQKLWNFYQDGTRKFLLAFHGPVPAPIHALDVLMTNPLKFLRAEGRGLASVFPAYEKAVMDNLAKQDYYDTALKAGLPIGPDDISTEAFPKHGWVARAMNAGLKPLRYELWENSWKRTPTEDQTPDYAHKLAIDYAHATGSMVKGEPAETYTRGLRQALLAPQYTPSKIMKTIFDPLETVRTFERAIESKVTKSVMAPTPEERAIAWNRTWRAGRWLGGTLIGLGVNDAILRWSGSNQRVNYGLDVPHMIRGDWMAFKFGGHMWRMRGSLELIALMSKIGALSVQKYKYGEQTPEEAVARYGEYKLVPGIGLGKELATGKDVFGRPVPWSSEIGSARFPRKNWAEFVGEHGPIFVGHAISAFHESLRNQGVDTRTLNGVYNAIMHNPQAATKAAEEGALAGGAEFFGVNVQPDRFIGKP